LLKLPSNDCAARTSTREVISGISFDTERIVYLLTEKPYVKQGFTSFSILCFAMKMQVMSGFAHRNELTEPDANPMF
jgi:hypothetical protein